MSIAAFLPNDSLAFLQAKLARETVTATSWRYLHAELENSQTKAVILDPADNAAPPLPDLFGILRSHPRKAVIAYTKICPKGLRAAFIFSRTQAEFVLHPFPGSSDDFSSLIERAIALRLGLEALSYLELAWSQLPGNLQLAVEDLFAHPRRYQCGADLAIAAGYSERALWHWIRGTRLGTPHRLVTVAKVLHGCSYLQRPELDLTEISSRVGYSGPKVFAENVRSVFGCTPLQLTKEIAPRELVLHALEWLYKPSPGKAESPYGEPAKLRQRKNRRAPVKRPFQFHRPLSIR